MTAQELRQWRGVRPVPGPAGVAISTRLRTTPSDELVLDAAAGRRQRRDRLNSRKRELTAHTSSRWASAIIGGNDDQYRLSRDAQVRHIIGLRAAISTIEKRLAQPNADMLTREQQTARGKA